MYRKSKRGRTLVGKNGVISKNSKKNVERLVNEIRNRDDISDKEKIGLISDLETEVKTAHINGKKLTVNGFFAKQEEDKINRLLVNAGYTAEELAEEIGVSVEDILDEKNWNKDTFMGVWQLQFNYTGEILKYVGATN